MTSQYQRKAGTSFVQAASKGLSQVKKIQEAVWFLRTVRDKLTHVTVIPIELQTENNCAKAPRHCENKPHLDNHSEDHAPDDPPLAKKSNYPMVDCSSLSYKSFSIFIFIMMNVHHRILWWTPWDVHQIIHRILWWTPWDVHQIILQLLPDHLLVFLYLL